jgi:hypothetical protein
MKDIYLITTIIIFSLLSITNKVQAYHYLGGEITWECIAAGQANAGKYIFQLKVYRECYHVSLPGNSGPQFDSTQTLMSNSPAGNISLVEIAGWPKDISPQCNPDTSFSHIACTGMPNGLINMGAIQEHIYRSQPIQLNGIPPTNGWIFYWSGSTRAIATNFPHANNDSWRLKAVMYPYGNQNMYPCFDNSPAFAARPKTIICTGYPNTINYFAYDRELDSLVYNWGNPMMSNGQHISYFGGYSYSSPFPSQQQNSNNIAAVINPKTGAISFTSYTTGAFLTSVKIAAYKDGTKVAEIWREVQVILTNCNANTKPTITATSANNSLLTDTLFVHAGDSIDFYINGTNYQLLPNSTSKTIELNANGNQLGAYIPPSGGNPATLSTQAGCINPPCATLTPAPNINNPLTAQTGVQTHFKWQTDCGHLNTNAGNNIIKTTNEYRFTFTVNDDYCPVPAYETHEIIIYVTPDTVATPILSSVNYNYTSLKADIQWQKYYDPKGIFIAYDIYHSNYLNGPYTFIDSLININQLGYSHNIASATKAYYYINVRNNACTFSGTSENSDTLSLNITDLNSEPQQTKFELFQNEPNPANGKTSIRYSINKATNGQFRLFDLSGRKVFTQKIYSRLGLNKFEFETSQLGEGIYFYSLSFENQQQIKKLIIIR